MEQHSVYGQPPRLGHAKESPSPKESISILEMLYEKVRTKDILSGRVIMREYPYGGISEITQTSNTTRTLIAQASAKPIPKTS